MSQKLQGGVDNITCLQVCKKPKILKSTGEFIFHPYANVNCPYLKIVLCDLFPVLLECITIVMSCIYKNLLNIYYRGFAQHSTHLYVHNFALPHGFLFVLHGIEKNNKTPFYFLSPSWQKLKFQPSVCTFILVTLCNFGIVVRTLKFRDIFLCFPIPHHAKWKPTWRSKVQWLAKSAWCDVTWKPSIVGPLSTSYNYISTGQVILAIHTWTVHWRTCTV